MEIKEFSENLEKFKGVVLEKLKAQESNFVSREVFEETLKKQGEALEASIKAQKEEFIKRKLNLGMEEKDVENFSFTAIVRSHLDKDFDWQDKSNPNFSFTKSVLDETKRKFAYLKEGNNGMSGSTGGYLIPDEASTKVIDLAMANIVVKDMGATIMPGLRGELPIPKITGRPTMYWVGENQAPSASQNSYGEIVLRPKAAAALAIVSEQLVYQSAGVAEVLLRRELVKAFQLGLDIAYLNGLGSEYQPKGVLNHEGLTPTSEIGSQGGRFTIDKAEEMQTAIDVANMLNGNLGYVMRPEVLSGLKRERISQWDGQPASEGQPVGAGMGKVLLSTKDLEQILGGYKIRTTTQLPNDVAKGGGTAYLSPVLFGDWAQLFIGMWEGFRIKSSDVAGTAFTQRQIWINAFQMTDCSLADETGMTVVDDAIGTLAGLAA